MVWIIFLLFILADAWFNHYRIKKGNRINHWLNVGYRSVVGVGFVWLFHLSGLPLLMFFLGGFFSFWLIFNLTLNLLNGQSIDYLGGTSLLDRFEAKLPWIVWFVWKIILSAGFIYGYYNTALL